MTLLIPTADGPNFIIRALNRTFSGALTYRVNLWLVEVTTRNIAASVRQNGGDDTGHLRLADILARQRHAMPRFCWDKDKAARSLASCAWV